MLSESQAQQYIRHLQENARPYPLDSFEFLSTNSVDTDEFVYTYGVLAANLAVACFKRNSWRGLELGGLVRVANTALILAVNTYLSSLPRNRDFVVFAQEMIDDDLDRVAGEEENPHR